MKSVSKQTGIILRCLLVALLAFTLVPAFAFAGEDGQTTTEETITQTNEPATSEEGEEAPDVEPIVEGDVEILDGVTEQALAPQSSELVTDGSEELTLQEDGGPQLPEGWTLAANEEELSAALGDSSISTIILTEASYVLTDAHAITRSITFATYHTADAASLPTASLYAAEGKRHFVVTAGSSMTFVGLAYDAGSDAVDADDRWTDLGQKNNIVLDGNSASGGIQVNVLGGYEINSAVVQNCVSSDKGGGIMTAFDQTANLSINNSIIQNNSATSNGGGMYAMGHISLNNTTVLGNSSTAEVGGGIFAGSITGDHVTLTDNSSKLQGGGALSYAGNIELTNSTVSNNTARWGGGLYTDNGNDIILTNVTLLKNKATDSVNAGGAIYTKHAGSDVAVNAPSQIDNNEGGGIVSGGAVTIDAKTSGSNGYSVSVSSNTGHGVYAAGSVTVTTTAPAAPVTFDNNGQRGIYTGGALTLDAHVSNNIIVASNNTSNTVNFAGAYGTGGAILVNNCLFEGNETASWGGGIGTQANVDFTVKNSNFIDNKCGTSGGSAGGCFGGAISSWSQTSLTVENCLFEGNDAGANGTASAIQMSPNATNTITNCTFDNNTAVNGWGIVEAWYMPEYTSVIGTSTFTGCSFSNNESNTGGAITSYNPINVVVDSCDFTDNSAVYGGAIALYHADYGLYQIKNSTFTGNAASGSGGAIYTQRAGSDLSVSSCTFTDNSAAWGGSIYGNDVPRIAVDNSTFKNNKATAGNAGAIQANNATNVMVDECEFQGNSSTNNGGALSGGSSATIDVKNSNFEGNYTEGYGGAITISRLKALTVKSTSFTTNVADPVYAGYVEDADTDEDEELDTTSYQNNILDVSFDTIYKSAYNNADIRYLPKSGVYDHLVRFWDYDNTLLEAQIVQTGGSAIPPATPNHSDLEFTGWIGTYTDVDSNRDVYASYKAAQKTQYTVSFLDHDGSVIQTSTVNEGESVTPPANPTRSGYSFTGWSMDSSAWTNVKAHATLYAQYSADEAVTPVTPVAPVEPREPGYTEGGGSVETAETVAVAETATPRANSIAEAAEAQDIDTVGVPLTTPEGYAAWALVNLILLVLSVLMTLVFVVQRVASRRKTDKAESTECEAQDKRDKRSSAWIVFAALATLASIVLFVLTQDLAQPMVWADNWTVLAAVLALATTTLGIISAWPKKEQKQDEAKATASAS